MLVSDLHLLQLAYQKEKKSDFEDSEAGEALIDAGDSLEVEQEEGN